MKLRTIPPGTSLLSALFMMLAWLPAAAQTTTAPAVSSPRLRSVSHALVGVWQSTTDPALTRRFDPDGTALDLYRGDPSATSKDTWRLVDRAHPDPALDSTEAGATYLRVENSQEVTFYQIIKVDAHSLRIRYTDRGGHLLTFVRLKHISRSTEQ